MGDESRENHQMRAVNSQHAQQAKIASNWLEELEVLATERAFKKYSTESSANLLSN